MEVSNNILKRLKYRWLLYKVLELLLYASCLAFLIACVVSLFYLLGPASLLIGSLIFFIPLFSLLLFLSEVLKVRLRDIARHLNSKFKNLEDSAELLLIKPSDLSLLGRLQRERVAGYIKHHQGSFAVPNHLHKAIILFIIIAGGAILLYNLQSPFQHHTLKDNNNVIAAENGISSGNLAEKMPEVKEAFVLINPPDYTNAPHRKTKEMNIEAPEGSVILWQISFTGSIRKAFLLLHNGDTIRLNNKQGKDTWSTTMKLSGTGYYNIQFQGKDDDMVISDYYKLTPIVDSPPSIIIIHPDQYIEMPFHSSASIQVQAEVKDDYAVKDAVIVATVSRGSGESVKFREQKLSFKTGFTSRKSHYKLSKAININELEMAPGDELYFYVQAMDNKAPTPNISKTETYFIKLSDTARQAMTMSDGLGVELMPEYFRSQRQIIIDTEKIISEKGKITDKTYKEKLNELGIDQKLLRLRYGQFLGEEFETGIGNMPEVPDIEHSDDGNAEHDHHDQEDHAENINSDSNPLSEYVHAHDTQEEATFFNETIKAQLKAALSQMWEAELRLRTYKPRQALPYEYKALELIKDIQQKSRVYVERIGFEPPVLKPEEKRLTGDLEDIQNIYRKRRLARQDQYPNIRAAIRIIEQLKEAKKITDKDKKLLNEAGLELPEIALKEPGGFLKDLQKIRKLSDGKVDIPDQDDYLISIQNALWNALPEEMKNPYKPVRESSELTKIYLKGIGGQK